MKTKETDGPSDLTLIQIMERFGTDEKARAFLESVRWPNGPVCPHCGNSESKTIYPIQSNRAKKVRDGLYECGACKEQFTVTVGTIFHKSKIPLRKWLLAWFLLCSSKKGISAHQIWRVLELGSYRTAWFMMHRIRFALRDPIFSDKLVGTVEADETWVGGKVHGKGRAYKGNKVPVVSVVERNGRVRSTAVKRVTSAALASVLVKNVDKNSVLMTDDFRGYQKPGQLFKAHHSVNHSAGEYVRGEAYTNTVEGFFSIFKRGVNGIYHHIGRPHVGQYLAEFDFRYNQRNVTDGARTLAGLRKTEGKRLMLHKPKARVTK